MSWALISSNKLRRSLACYSIWSTRSFGSRASVRRSSISIVGPRPASPVEPAAANFQAQAECKSAVVYLSNHSLVRIVDGDALYLRLSQSVVRCEFDTVTLSQGTCQVSGRKTFRQNPQRQKADEDENKGRICC